MKRDSDKANLKNIQLENSAALASKEACGKRYVSFEGVRREIKSGIRYLNEICLKAEEFCSKHGFTPPEFEWLMDNSYVIARAASEVIEQLESDERYPSCKSQPVPVIFHIAKTCMASCLNHVETEYVIRFVNTAQQERPLSEKEIGQLIPSIKAALILAAVNVCGHIENIMRSYAQRSGYLENPFAAELSMRDMESTEDVVRRKLVETARALHLKLADLLGNVVNSLNLLSDADYTNLLEEISPLHSILSEDPDGTYCKMDKESRSRYRGECAKIGRQLKMSETEVARRSLELAKASTSHNSVGFWLFDMPLGQLKKDRDTAPYFIVLGITAFVTTALLTLFSPAWYFCFFYFIPLWGASRNIAARYAAANYRPHVMPKLRLKDGVPDCGRTLCVLSALITSEHSIKGLVQRLEDIKIQSRNCGKNLVFGVLADLKDSKEQQNETDIAMIKAAENAINELNEKYDGGFYLFFRSRTFNKQEKLYMGWERKRGAILELVRFIKGEHTSIDTVIGNEDFLRGVRFIITLDSDTEPGPDNLKRLIGTALHPLNYPVLSDDGKRVVSGYGILQPAIGVTLSGATKSWFSIISSRRGGSEIYSSISSDVYQDVFSEGNFCGKGLLNVDVFYKILNHAFEENRILSHDLLEGAYVKTAYLSDIKMHDGYPSGVLSYYDRMHRWTRGDWQVFSWVFPKVRNEEGKRIKNPISRLSKYKIFDNIWRSFVPPSILAALFVGAALDNVYVPAICLFFALFTGNLISGIETVVLKRNYCKKYYSRILPGFSGDIAELFMRISFLPYEAYIFLWATLSVAYRFMISRKNFLMWVTAAESEKKGSKTLTGHVLKMWIGPVLAIALLMVDYGIISIFFAILWGASPFAAYLLSKSAKKKRYEPSKDEEEMLLSQAEKMFSYFCDFMVKRNNFLPPDNWQEQPAMPEAPRTSPTNIGMALLSILAACDLGICPPETGIKMIKNCLNTVFSLEKWNGHLFNWYDIKTLKPLIPAYISSVDSGNLVGCLLVLAAGLEEYGEIELSEKIRGFAAETDFKCLFNPTKNLFHIGYDYHEGKLSNSYYDLLASEARQLSYITVAAGAAPVKHWKKLSRPMSKADGYRGMFSWTGTMFEYFMPELILPCFENSLIYESVMFAGACQIKRGQERNVPFGISESGFYAFDSSLNYQYKAHGVQRLALKRGMDTQLVISPYSTYIAISGYPKECIANIRRMLKLGFEGKYGLFEAIDYTESRVMGNYELVQSFMAHHVGMSIVSITNFLKDNIMQKRFLQEPCMRAYTEILQEMVPEGGPVMQKKRVVDIPEKPKAPSAGGFLREGRDYSVWQPVCNTLSNGVYTVNMTDTGLSWSKADGIAVNRFRYEQFDNPSGMIVALKTEDKVRSLTPAPYFDKDISYSYRFTGNCGEYKMVSDGIETYMNVTVAGNENGEIRDVLIKNTGDSTIEGELLIYFEPVLINPDDDDSHPAFYGLFMKSFEKDGIISFRRRPRDAGENRYLGFGSDGVCVGFDTSREKALPRGEGAFEIASASMREPAYSLGEVLDPCLFYRIKVSVPSGQEQKIKFVLCLSQNHDAVHRGVEKMLKGSGLIQNRRHDLLCRLLELSPSDITFAGDLLTEQIFLTRNREETDSSDRGQSFFWKFGISGDLPLTVVRVSRPETVRKLSSIIKASRYLKLNGHESDLIILHDDSGEYTRPVLTRVLEEIRYLGCEYLLNHRGGIFPLSTGSLNSEELKLIISTANAYFDLDGSKTPNFIRENDDKPLQIPKLSVCRETSEIPVEFNDFSLSFNLNGTLPKVPWSHVMANRSFGCVITETGAGHMWRDNSREFKLTPWTNDQRRTVSGERLELICDGQRSSLFAAADGLPCRVTYGAGYATYKKHIGQIITTTSVYVPAFSNCRVTIVELKNNSDVDMTVSVRQYIEPVLGVSRKKTARHLKVELAEENLLKITNRFADDFRGYEMYLASDRKASGYASVKQQYWKEEFSENLMRGASIAAANYNIEIPAGQTESIVLNVLCTKNEEELKRILTEYLDFESAKKKLSQTKEYVEDKLSKIQIKTPDKDMDTLVNFWLSYQTLICRIWARSSFYQCGGAYGFRDQLQDAYCLAAIDASYLRTQILKHCAHQFYEGDVQHWWHPMASGWEAGSPGVRTRCSDDLLWLPYAVAEYIETTGDMEILDIEIPYLEGEELKEGQHEKFFPARAGRTRESVYHHCVRAIEKGIKKGERSLLLMGSGDWNDGMNLVGAEGKGESVWLTFFAADILKRFSEVCTFKNDKERAQEYIEEARKLVEAVNKNAWDGQWYKRAFYDDGTPMGSKGDEECEIDSIAQSFSAFAPFTDSDRAKQAVSSAVNILVDEDNRLIRLFTPSFADGPKNPGYIKGYLPGVRENGGQYTHASLWLAKSCFVLGDYETGYRLLEILNPLKKQLSKYLAEPYVITADIYTAEGNAGRGGWSWYTGAAGWYLNVCLQNLLGIKTYSDRFEINPKIPQSWDGFSARYRVRGTDFNITVKRTGKEELFLNGKKLETGGVPYEAKSGDILKTIK